MATISHQIPRPKVLNFVFSDTRMAWVWLVVRVYVGWAWFQAGWEKVVNPAWAGSGAGAALKGFLGAALKKTAGDHPDVAGWYAYFLNHVVIPHPAIFSNLVAYGEVLVGIGLILGALTGLAAFFALFMNMNYLLAGTVSINPQLLLWALLLMLSWRIAGWVGLDHWLLPKIFHRR